MRIVISILRRAFFINDPVKIDRVLSENAQVHDRAFANVPGLIIFRVLVPHTRIIKIRMNAEVFWNA